MSGKDRTDIMTSKRFFIRFRFAIVGAETDSLRCSGMTLDSDSENNLVLKALRSLRKKYTIPPLAVYLRKAIPFGAGLGGGSADAAFMLKLVSEYYRLSISDDELEEIASFISNPSIYLSAHTHYTSLSRMYSYRPKTHILW